MTSSPNCSDHLRVTLVFSAILVCLAGCSNRQVYEASHQNRLQECEKLVAAQYQQCIDDYNQSYDEYRRHLEATKK